MINDYDIKFKPTGFDYVNPRAKVILVGITPGNTQLVASREGKSLVEIKKENAFAGGMRNNLIRMLDHIGANTLLGIETCVTLWEAVLFVAMGDGVMTVLSRLKEEGVVSADIVAIPHPSGANAGRISVFLGSKPAADDCASKRAYEQFQQATATISRLCCNIPRSNVMAC